MISHALLAAFRIGCGSELWTNILELVSAFEGDKKRGQNGKAVNGEVLLYTKNCSTGAFRQFIRKTKKNYPWNTGWIVLTLPPWTRSVVNEPIQIFVISNIRERANKSLHFYYSILKVT